MSWQAVDAGGTDLATGRPPRFPGAPTPAAAMARAPVVIWPLAAVDQAGRPVGLGEALGDGGRRVEDLVGRIATGARPPPELDVGALARDTPAGTVDLPVDVVAAAVASQAARAVDRAWLTAVDDRRDEARDALVAAGRDEALEAALHVAVLVATGRLRAAEDDPASVVASGAWLWLLGGAVAWALRGLPVADDPFASWADLLSWGLWPVGPTGGRLVVGSLQGCP